MAPIIEENKKRITSVCDKHKLKYLYVFGSAARGTDFSATSDIDLLYAFDKEKITSYAVNFFDFLFELEDLLEKKNRAGAGRKHQKPLFFKTS